MPTLKQERTLLTVSGGIDSAVMAHLFHKLGLDAGIAHCNFGLRGEESEADERFVHELSKTYRFPFFSKRFDVKSLARQKGISTQMAARELRYEWFEEIRKQHGFQWIATAHHATDSLETTLLNLVRGTGLAGLHGISGVISNIIRPLILASREEIANYAQEHGIVWQEDRSNDTDDYKRNLIRHKVTPVLRELNPSLESTFNTSSERLKAANVLLKEYLESWKSRILLKSGNSVKIPIEELLKVSEPGYRLWSILQEYGFVYAQIAGVTAALSGNSGKTFFSHSHALLIDREYIILKIRESVPTEETIISVADERFQWESWDFTITSENPGELVQYDSNMIVVDAVRLNFPLKVRRWKQGDIFFPFGMKGSRKKVSDLLIDRKLDRFEKERVGVLLNGDGEIIWVIGIRADERFRLTEHSEKKMIISARKRLEDNSDHP